MTQEIFFGELIALIWFIMPQIRSKKRLLCSLNQTKTELENGKLPIKSRFWIGAGGIFDAISSCFQLVGLLFLPINLYLLIKNGTIIFCILFSIIVLKTQLNRKQWISLLVILGGLILVALSKIIANTDNSTDIWSLFDLQTMFGFAVMIISVAISGFQIVYQEYLFRTYSVDPRELTGLEGLYGLCVMTLVLIATSFLECDNPTICRVGHPIDSPGQAVSQIWVDSQLIFIVYVTILSSLIFNVCGASLVKNNSAIFRMIIDCYRTVVTWIILLIINPGETKVIIIVMQLAGTVLLIIGNAMYSKSTYVDHTLMTSKDSYQILSTQ